ncbi:glycosyltransferase family 2 protein [Enterococcus gallinarum]|uniref:glycosyltransferase family 2 protein n=1 Tax=Enterococcus gallinarum TaxID=1353 RepID=UPI000F4EA629|nr:glycosyltransferase family 2 protein [Enterococcus gallinarum]ROY85508.1 glycosyltransferase family 2 protein [Enterococcus gallinarum]
MRKKTITIIVVARNEEKSLDNILTDILNQSYDHSLIDIILIDSLSSDNTLKIMEKFRENKEFKNISVLINKNKILAYGWNMGIEKSTTDLVVRVDAHSSIPKDFIEKNIDCINKGERVSGGARPNVLSPSDKTKWNEALLAAEGAIFGSSIAPYRNSKKSRYVNSVFHGVYDRKIFDEIGLLNVSLGRTEDNELHYRMRQNGISLSYNPNIISYQYVRSSLRKMIKQKFLNGYWIGLTTYISIRCFSIFHFIPLFFVISLVMSTLLSFLHVTSIPLLLMGCTYLAFLLLTVASTYVQKSFNLYYCCLFFILPLLHIAYGTGTLIGLFMIPFRKEGLENGQKASLLNISSQ